MLDRVAQRFSDLRGKQRRIFLKGAVEIVGRLLTTIQVVFGKATVEKDVNRIVDGKALQEFVIFAEV